MSVFLRYKHTDIDGPLIVAEGIESALSFERLYSSKGRVWAALSTSGMAGLILADTPPTETVGDYNLAVAADRGKAGSKAADTPKERTTLAD